MLIREEPLDDLLFVVDMIHKIPPEREAHYQSSIRENMNQSQKWHNPRKKDAP
jgi:hypothetical protein